MANKLPTVTVVVAENRSGRKIINLSDWPQYADKGYAPYATEDRDKILGKFGDCPVVPGAPVAGSSEEPSNGGSDDNETGLSDPTGDEEGDDDAFDPED